MKRAFKSSFLTESWVTADQGVKSAKYKDEVDDLTILLSNPSANYDMEGLWWRVLIKPTEGDVAELTPEQIQSALSSLPIGVKKYNVSAIVFSGQYLNSIKKFARLLANKLGWQIGRREGELAISEFGFGPKAEVELSNGWILQGPEKKKSKMNSLKKSVEKSGPWETATELHINGDLKSAFQDYELAFVDFDDMMGDNDITLQTIPLKKI